MTIAKEIEIEFRKLPVNDKGFVLITDAFEKWAKNMLCLMKSSKLECPESCDSTLEIVFEDGSKARFANPKQWVYPADFHEERA